MLLHAFIPASRANGPGLRAVIYFQGCSLNCPGCWNPTSYKFRSTDLTCDLIHKVAVNATLCFPNNGAATSY